MLRNFLCNDNIKYIMGGYYPCNYNMIRIITITNERLCILIQSYNKIQNNNNREGDGRHYFIRTLLPQLNAINVGKV